MAKNEVKINIFVASPSDVNEERNLLKSICDELNNVWGDWLGLNLNLMKWETHTYPAISDYSQNAINEQIDDNYDIFIALFWNRFGTPTKIALSGTEEELNRALNKYEKQNDLLDIMVYFKEQTINYSNKEQQKKVNELKEKLENKGTIYYRTFRETKDFESLLRMNLSKVAQKWSKKDLLNYQKKKNIALNQKIELQLNEYYFLLSGKTGLLSVVHANILNTLDLFLVKQNQTIEMLKVSNSSTKSLDVFSFIMEDIVNILDNHILLLEKTRKDFFEILSKVVSLEIGLKYDSRLDMITDLINSWIEVHPKSINEIEYMREYLMLFTEVTDDFVFIRNKLVSLFDKYCIELQKEIIFSKDILSIINEHKYNL